MRRSSFKILALIAGLAFAVPAFAAPPAGGGKIEVLDALVIEGKIQKPQVFYVLSRHKMKYEGLQLKKSFLAEIERSIQDNPF